MNRRFFLFAAPAIVAAPSLMKVSALVMPSAVIGETVQIWPGQLIYQLSPEVINQAIRTNALLQWAQDRALVESISGISDLMRGAQSA